jgi:hypothetical protein
MRERCVAGPGYSHFSDFRFDWTSETLEPFDEIFSERLLAAVFEWGREIKLHDIVGVVPHTLVGVFLSESFAIVVNDYSNLCLVRPRGSCFFSLSSFHHFSLS